MVNLSHVIRDNAYRLKNKFGWVAICGILFYPIILFITTPVRLIQTFWNCRILSEGRWNVFSHFNPHNGINCLFYWTQAENLSYFGRNGISPYVGLGRYYLGKWWHLCLFATYGYWKAACTIPLLGLLGWWLGHFLWLGLPGLNLQWFLTVVFIVLCSTTFYINIFILQNYNAIGWIFMPVGLYGLFNSDWTLVAMAWLGASLGSITVVIFSGILSIVFAVQIANIWPILMVLPAALKILTHFWPFLSKQKLAESVTQTGKAIGLFRSNTKFKRKMHFGIREIYNTIIATQFLIIYWVIVGVLPWLLLAAILLYVVNIRFFRIADPQNVIMLILSVSTCFILQSRQIDWVLLFSFWISISPIPAFAGIPNYHGLFAVPVMKPFNVAPLIKDMEQFLRPVQKDQRVLMAFENPNGDYSRIFDGYRALLELPLYVASRKRFHFMPDWYGIVELNYEGAPDFWGREPQDVSKQMKTWNADYVVVYQNSGTTLDRKWSEANFEVLSHFSWAKYKFDAEPIKPFIGSTPDWWLLHKV